MIYSRELYYLPITNQAYVEIRKVNAVVPVCSVQQCAFVLVDARNRRPLPVVQNARRVDKDITMIFEGLTALKIPDLHVVAALGLVPSCASNLMPCLDIFVKAVLTREIVEVSEDLF
jgi:hypothetical protein